MTIDVQERDVPVRSPGIGALVVGLLVLVFIFPSIKSSVGWGSGDTKCAPWPSGQGEWYSVPPELLTVTADYPRMVDKSGVWARSGFGLTKGWIYAAKTPDGPLAYWAVAKDENPMRGTLSGSDGNVIEVRYVTWLALNREAMALSLSALNWAAGVNPANVKGMLTDQIKDSIAHCLGY